MLARRYKYNAYILGVYDPHFSVFRYASKFSGRQLRILATKYARGRKNFPAKKLSIYNFKKLLFFFFFYVFLPFLLPTPISLLFSYPLSYTHISYFFLLSNFPS